MARQVKPVLIPDKNSWLGVRAQMTPTSLTLPKDLSYEKWAEIGSKIGRVRKFCTWAISDWLNFGEAKYGETYTQAAALTDYAPEYLCILKHVGAKVDPARRRESLTFSHHKCVAMLEPEDQDRLLREAETNHWSRDELAEAVRGFTGKKQIGGRDKERGEIMDTIRITSREFFGIRRRRCTACGGWTDKASICFAFIDPADNAEEILCDNCARDPHDIPGKLLKHAAHLRVVSDHLCKLAEYKFVEAGAEALRHVGSQYAEIRRQDI
jgi:hypothetical protein